MSTFNFRKNGSAPRGPQNDPGRAFPDPRQSGIYEGQYPQQPGQPQQGGGMYGEPYYPPEQQGGGMYNEPYYPPQQQPAPQPSQKGGLHGRFSKNGASHQQDAPGGYPPPPQQPPQGAMYGEPYYPPQQPAPQPRAKGAGIKGLLGKAGESAARLKSKLLPPAADEQAAAGGDAPVHSRTGQLSAAQQAEFADTQPPAAQYLPARPAAPAAPAPVDDFDDFDDLSDLDYSPSAEDAQAFAAQQFEPQIEQRRTSLTESAAQRRERAAQAEFESMEGGVSDRLNSQYIPDKRYESHHDGVGYVPPTAMVPKSHLRSLKRNKRPWRQWQKTSLTTLCIVAFFAALIFITFMSLITSRVFYTADSIHNTVYLTVDENRALAQEETAIEENLTEFTVPAIDITSDEDVKIILLIASDQRFGKGTSSNCDSLMLLVIDQRFKQIKLISIMSELYVRIPGYYSNKLGKAFYYDTAKGDYSLSLLRQTIKDNFAIAIDNYVVVDFKALETLVNRLGGVTMELTPEEADYMRADPKYGLFPRYTYGGVYNMSGPETLNYVRIKKVGDVEFERTQRQRKVMYELLGKIQKLSFVEKSELAYAMLPLLATDMSRSDIWYYFTHAKEISKYPVDQLRIPIEGSFRYGETTVLGNTFEVLVTNYAFTSEAIRNYIYKNDTTYQGNAFAEDVIIPTVAPLPEMLAEAEAQQ